MLSLSIQHHIFLTREERYRLHQGEDVSTVGISIPVWHTETQTGEPAREIFCKYYLKNNREDLPIKILADGYEIHMPMRESYVPEITDEEWRDLNKNNGLYEFYRSQLKEVSSKCLLDPADGGGKNLEYRELNRLRVEKSVVDVVHFVIIDDLDLLKQTRITVNHSGNL